MKDICLRSILLFMVLLFDMPMALHCRFKRSARENRLTTKNRQMMHVLANKEAHRIEDEKKQHIRHIHPPHKASAKIVIDSNRLVNGIPDNPNFPSNVNNYNPTGLIGGMIGTLNSVVHGSTALAHNVISSGTQLSTDLIRSQGASQSEIQRQQTNDMINHMLDEARVEQHRKDINYALQQSEAKRGIMEGTMKGNGVIHVSSRVGY